MLKFNSIEDAEAFIKENVESLNCIYLEAESISGVVRSELWINGIPPSYVVGLDINDAEMVCFPLSAWMLAKLPS